MRAEKLVVESHRTVAEIKLLRAEVREAGRRAVLTAEGARVYVQPEAAHLARAREEGAPAHRRQLLQPALFAPLVLEPDLKPGAVAHRPRLVPELFNGSLSLLSLNCVA